VEVTHACGTLQDSTYVQDMGLRVPNLVTANGDQKNDYFELVKKGTDAASVQIYDSWGSQIYSTEDYTNSWPPADLPAGIYYYHYSVFNCSGKGWVQVVK
jgi:gliding motility-associated-like protein